MVSNEVTRLLCKYVTVDSIKHFSPSSTCLVYWYINRKLCKNHHFSGSTLSTLEVPLPCQIVLSRNSSWCYWLMISCSNFSRTLDWVTSYCACLTGAEFRFTMTSWKTGGLKALERGKYNNWKETFFSFSSSDGNSKYIYLIKGWFLVKDGMI